MNKGNLRGVVDSLHQLHFEGDGSHDDQGGDSELTRGLEKRKGANNPNYA
jgi:hypothetical protein